LSSQNVTQIVNFSSNFAQLKKGDQFEEDRNELISKSDIVSRACNQPMLIPIKFSGLFNHAKFAHTVANNSTQ